jgi:uncharacterized protein with FMN-binding domain
MSGGRTHSQRSGPGPQRAGADLRRGQSRPRRAAAVLMALAALICPTMAPAQPAPATRPSLTAALSELKVPPDWFECVTVRWDVNRPWQEARLEVRRLLGLGPAEVAEGVKITWLYAQKKDNGDGHELPMYLFMSGHYAWALKEYERFMPTVAGKGPTHAYLAYASCFAHFGEYAKAMQVLEAAMKDLPPPPWTIMNRANVHNAMGDLYAQMGQVERAKAEYAEAIRLYPTSDQPFGRHLLPRYVAKVRTKLDLLTFDSLATAKLRDGTFRGRSLGYADARDVEVILTVKDGRIADIRVNHDEKIDLNATSIVPRAIIAKQSLKVDAVTGATVTSQAVVDGAYQALKQAGLR